MPGLDEIKEMIVDGLGSENGEKINLCLESHLEVHKEGYIVFGNDTIFRSEKDVKDNYRGQNIRTLSVAILKITSNFPGNYQTQEYSSSGNISESQWKELTN